MEKNEPELTSTTLSKFLERYVMYTCSMYTKYMSCTFNNGTCVYTSILIRKEGKPRTMGQQTEYKRGRYKQNIILQAQNTRYFTGYKKGKYKQNIRT